MPLTMDQVNKRARNKTKKLNWLMNNGHISEVDIKDGIVIEKVKDIPSKQVKVSDLINDNFVSVMQNKKPYFILKGGRSSFKSSAVSIKLVVKFLQDPLANVFCFRKVGKYLSQSVYEQIKWAIIKLGVAHEFTFLKSPMKIIHNATQSAFYFYGVDDPVKIKSAKIAIGYVIALWFEEAAEFDGEEEIDTVQDTFIREKLPDNKQVEVYFTYNPPRNPYSWINEWVEKVKDDDDYYIHHSTYLEDKKGFLSGQFLARIINAKKNDPDYHDWMYLGKVIGLGDVIYNINLFKRLDDLPSDDRLLFADIAIDAGYSTSATTFLFIGYTLKRNVILLDTYYYSPANKAIKKAPSDFSKELWEFYETNKTHFKTNVDTWTIDSAEAGLRNQFFKDKGTSLTPARKKKKYQMIENVEDLLVQGRFYYLDTEHNKIFIEEHKKYQWEEKSKNTDDPKVVKEDDHTCDAFQYYVNNNLSKLGLKA